MTSDSTTKATVLITGASTGIGATYADRFAKRGHDLILVARDAARLEALAGKLAAEYGVKADVLRADLTDAADLAVVEERLRSDESIGVLINNAGIATTGGISDGDADVFETMITLNITAPVRLATVAAPGFAARKGAIINISSVLALAPEAFNGVYSATKAAILNFSQALAVDLEAKGARVQVVLPGATRTEIWERSGHDIDALPPEMLMGVDELVDTALLGFDRGETVTIPPLEEIEEFNEMTRIRQGLGSKLSKSRAGSRYRETVAG